MKRTTFWMVSSESCGGRRVAAHKREPHAQGNNSGDGQSPEIPAANTERQAEVKANPAASDWPLRGANLRRNLR